MGEIVHLYRISVHLGIYWASVYKSFIYSLDALCQPVSINLLHINPILLSCRCNGTGNNRPRITLMFLACAVNAGGP